MSDIQPWQNSRTNPRSPAAAAIKAVAEPPFTAWLRVWWPALAWAVFIFVMSTDEFSSERTRWFFEPIIRWFAPTLTKAQLALVHHYIRKCAHFTEYFVFAALLYRGIRGLRTGWRWSWALAALAIAAGYSALDEVHQAFVASREARMGDSLLDSAGAFVAVLVLWMWFRRRVTNSTA